MSINRTLQSHTRRAGVPDNNFARTQPQPSIKSSQAFHNPNQGIPGKPNQGIPGKPNPNQNQGIQGIPNQNQGIQGGTKTKITLQQAIALITLRLSSIESKLIQDQMEKGDFETMNPNDLYDMSQRLDTIEKKITNTSMEEVLKIKKQIETIKQAINKTTKFCIQLEQNNKKDVTELKSVIDDLTETLSNTNHTLQELTNRFTNPNDELENDELEVDGLNIDGLNVDGLNVDGLNVDGLDLELEDDGLELEGDGLELEVDGLNVND
jgi:hypothetical protein